MNKEIHNIEYCLEIAHNYRQKPVNVVHKHAEIFENLINLYPNMSKE